MHELHQIISDPTHLLPDSLSCTDFIFTDQSNFAVDCGVHPFLHSNCHYQISYCKFNLMIKYPYPYERLVLDHNRVDQNLTVKVRDQFDKKFFFFNKYIHKHVHKKIHQG